MRVILFQPEIPQNAGNIVRTCSITGSNLSLVKPLGFKTTDKYLKRAGLDYWDEVDVTYVDDFKSYLDKLSSPIHFFSSKATRLYTDIEYGLEDNLVFGSETSGLPQYYHENWRDHFYTLPMLAGKRSLNLSNTVSIVLYEAFRQNKFNFQ